MTPEEQQYYDSLMGNKAEKAAAVEHNTPPDVDYKEYAKQLGVPVDDIKKEVDAEAQAPQGGAKDGQNTTAMFDITMGATQGAIDLAQTVINGGHDIANYLEDFAASHGMGTGELIQSGDLVDWSSKLASPEDSVTTRATRQIVKYAAPVGAVMATGGGALTALGTGAAVDLLMIDPKSERLSTMLRDNVPELKNYPVAYKAVSALSNNPEDSNMTSRFKNMVEGLGIGAGVAGIFTGVNKALAARKGLGAAASEAVAAGASKPQALEATAAKMATEADLAATEAKLGSNADIPPVVAPAEQLSLYDYKPVVETSTGPKVNLNNDNVVGFAAEFAKANPKTETDLFRSSKPFAELDSEAKSIITDQGKLEKLLSWKLGDRPLTDAETKASQYIMSNTYDNVVDAAVKASNSGKEEDILHLSNMIDAFKYIDGVRGGAGSEAGRALNAHKLSADLMNTSIESFNANLTAQGRQQLLADALKAAGGKDEVLDIAKTIRAISELPGDKVANALSQAPQLGGFAKFKNVLQSVAINGMLSSPKTVTANFISNTLTSFTSTLTNYTATGIGFARNTPDGIRMADANNNLRGMFGGLFEGFGAAGQAMRRGSGGPANIIKGDLVTPLNAVSAEALGIPIEQNLAYKMIGKVVDITGLAVGLPSRINATADAFWGTVLYRGKVYEEATAAAREAGLTGKEAAAFIQEKVANVPVALHESAVAHAQENTFSKALVPGSFAEQADNLIEKIPAGRVVAPFFKTSANIIEYGFKHSPLALLSTPIRQSIARGGKEGDIALAKVIVGSTMLSASAYMASEGMITGPETRNWKIKQALQESGLGWQPDSIKIGDTYVSVNRIDPFSSVMRLGAVMSQLRNAVKDDAEYEQLAMIAGGAVADFMTPEMMVDGYSRLFEAYNEAARYDNQKDKVGAVFTDVLSRYIPYSSLQRDLKKNKDPYVGSTAIVTQDRNFLDKFTDRIINRYKSISPWHSTDLPIQRNIFGEPLMVPDGAGPDMISPFAITKVGGSEVVQKLQKLAGFKEELGGSDDLPDMDIQMPSKTWSPVSGTGVSIELTPPEYERLIMYSAGLNPDTNEKLGGASLRDSMDEVLGDLKNVDTELSPMEYQKIVGKISGVLLKYRNLGKKMMANDPEVMGRWQKALDASTKKQTVDVFQ